MNETPYELITTADGVVARIRARGSAVLAAPTINRGTAFTVEERRTLGLTGLLPTGVTTLEGQLRRVYAQYRAQEGDLRKWVYLANLRDRNEVLFHRLLSEHISEMLPVVYTPTVGLAIERFSHEFRRPRGVYLSVDHPEDTEAAFLNSGMGSDDVDLIVVTDSEGILGIGDQGVGGIEIAIGKLAVYTAAAGIHPHRVIPVVLDMGTDNLRLLNDEMYLGTRHARVQDQRYDDLIDAFVTTATKLFPDAMLHWEDFGAGNARRILQRYADRCSTFNDDMQGTAAVVLAAAFAAVRAAGTRLRDQRVVIHGAGTAGLGIADMMRDEMVREGLDPREATRRFWALGRSGLLTEDDADRLYDFQLPYARPASEVAGWSSSGDGGITLADVVSRVRPTMLIGTSTQTGAFTEAIVAQMAADTERPIIMPLSNPTSRCEARPEDLIRWTDGRALVATGSPFAPVVHGDRTYRIAQANNALVFPGLGLGVTVARARRISDHMIAAAADAVAQLSDAQIPGAPLLPPVEDLRTVSAAVAVAVALTAAEEGLTQVDVDDPIQQVHQAMWRPEYPRIEVGTR
ncbi:NAD-dependent malic enzyme [Pseudonocardia sp. H11422]|uniref:NAD-dependent malic enzyme n=1 Tax=Pseudonocardia sp. H11422 TaxID=2835866 RepID=UPI001BDC329D|nr:NAD-dependent malic enzyme [Pseudonocardia sp. H11422]